MVAISKPYRYVIFLFALGQVSVKFVSCHVVDKLSSKLVLGMEWLTSVNPTIWWFDCEVDLAFDNSVVMLCG